MTTLFPSKINKKGINPDWFATLFAIFLGAAIFLLFALLTYGGQKTITQKIEDQKLFFDIDQDLRTMLRSPLLSGTGQASDQLNTLIQNQNKVTFADLIDMISYDPDHREAYLTILRVQASSYLYSFGNPNNYEIIVYYSQQPPGSFREPTGYGLCYGAAFCVFSNNLEGETIVGKVDYPSIKSGQVITVAMVRTKTLSALSQGGKS